MGFVISSPFCSSSFFSLFILSSVWTLGCSCYSFPLLSLLLPQMKITWSVPALIFLCCFHLSSFQFCFFNQSTMASLLFFLFFHHIRTHTSFLPTLCIFGFVSEDNGGGLSSIGQHFATTHTEFQKPDTLWMRKLLKTLTNSHWNHFKNNKKVKISNFN